MSWGTVREPLAPNQIGILMMLLEHPGGLRIGELATREQDDAGNITRAVAKLEAMDYVERHATEADGRAVLVVASRSGRALGKKLIRQRDQFLQSTFSKFTPKERRQLLDYLNRINAALESSIFPRSGEGLVENSRRRARG